MPYCDNCGGWVSENFHRVFKDKNGDLWGCMDCGTVSAGDRRTRKHVENTGQGQSWD